MLAQSETRTEAETISLNNYEDNHEYSGIYAINYIILYLDC